MNRNSGSGVVQNLKLVFADTGGNTKVLTKTPTAALGEFESASFTVTSAELSGFTPASLKIAAVVQITNDPAGRTCDIRPAQVTCA